MSLYQNIGPCIYFKHLLFFIALIHLEKMYYMSICTNEIYMYMHRETCVYKLGLYTTQKFKKI